MDKITEQQLKETWNTDGYIKLSTFFDKSQVNKLSEYLDEISTWGISQDKWMTWFEKTSEGKVVLGRIERFLDFHLPLRDLVFSDNRIEKVVENLLGQEVRVFKDRIIFKHPDSGGYLPHQDIYSTVYNIPEEEMAIVAIFIDESNEDNGCLYIAPGKHKDGILPQDTRAVLKPEVYENYKWDVVSCNPGDVVIFHNYAPHYSNMNKSNQQRRAIYFPFQIKATTGLSREEYYKRKVTMFPPEGLTPDINNLRKQNDIVSREVGV